MAMMMGGGRMGGGMGGGGFFGAAGAVGRGGTRTGGSSGLGVRNDPEEDYYNHIRKELEKAKLRQEYDKYQNPEKYADPLQDKMKAIQEKEVQDRYKRLFSPPAQPITGTTPAVSSVSPDASYGGSGTSDYAPYNPYPSASSAGSSLVGGSGGSSSGSSAAPSSSSASTGGAEGGALSGEKPPVQQANGGRVRFDAHDQQGDVDDDKEIRRRLSKLQRQYADGGPLQPQDIAQAAAQRGLPNVLQPPDKPVTPPPGYADGTGKKPLPAPKDMTKGGKVPQADRPGVDKVPALLDAPPNGPAEFVVPGDTTKKLDELVRRAGFKGGLEEFVKKHHDYGKVAQRRAADKDKSPLPKEFRQAPKKAADSLIPLNKALSEAPAPRQVPNALRMLPPEEPIKFKQTPEPTAVDRVNAGRGETLRGANALAEDGVVETARSRLPGTPPSQDPIERTSQRVRSNAQLGGGPAARAAQAAQANALPLGMFGEAVNRSADASTLPGGLRQENEKYGALAPGFQRIQDTVSKHNLVPGYKANATTSPPFTDFSDDFKAKAASNFNPSNDVIEQWHKEQGALTPQVSADLRRTAAPGKDGVMYPSRRGALESQLEKGQQIVDIPGGRPTIMDGQQATDYYNAPARAQSMRDQYQQAQSRQKPTTSSEESPVEYMKRLQGMQTSDKNKQDYWNAYTLQRSLGQNQQVLAQNQQAREAAILGNLLRHSPNNPAVQQGLMRAAGIDQAGVVGQTGAAEVVGPLGRTLAGTETNNLLEADAVGKLYDQFAPGIPKESAQGKQIMASLLKGSRNGITSREDLLKQLSVDTLNPNTPVARDAGLFGWGQDNYFVDNGQTPVVPNRKEYEANNNRFMRFIDSLGHFGADVIPVRTADGKQRFVSADTANEPYLNYVRNVLEQRNFDANRSSAAYPSR